jgi:hypothetical protein
VAHAELILPESFVKPGSNYPAAGAEYGEGKVVEHYSLVILSTEISEADGQMEKGDDKRVQFHHGYTDY